MSAKGGEVFCLSAGNAGEIDLYNTNPASTVTIQPAPGVSKAQVSGYFNYNGVGHVTVTGMTVDGMVSQQGSNTHDIAFTNDAFNGSTTISCPPVNSVILFDHDTFLNISPGSGYEGRIEVVCANTVSPGWRDDLQQPDERWPVRRRPGRRGRWRHADHRE